MLDATATDLLQQMFSEAPNILTRRIEVRPFNLLELKAMRALNPDGPFHVCVSVSYSYPAQILISSFPSREW